jgi:hypothetical protein
MNKLLIIGILLFSLAITVAPKIHAVRKSLDLGKYQISSILAESSHNNVSTGDARKLHSKFTKRSKPKHRHSSVGLNLGLSSEQLNSLVHDPKPTVTPKKNAKTAGTTNPEDFKKLMAQVDKFLGEPDAPDHIPAKKLKVQLKATKKPDPKKER